MKNEIMELIGKEFDFVELDNIMVSNNFYSVFNDGITEDIKRDKNVIYTDIKNNEATLIIDFNIVIDNSKDEDIENFVLKVNKIEKY
ncbi:MAG: hypothetical protein RR406_04805 [Bacilli bacterium]